MSDHDPNNKECPLNEVGLTHVPESGSVYEGGHWIRNLGSEKGEFAIYPWDCSCQPAVGSAAESIAGYSEFFDKLAHAMFPPAADEVEQIRATLDITSATDRANHEIALSLLRIVDQLRAENANLLKVAEAAKEYINADYGRNDIDLAKAIKYVEEQPK